MYAHCKMACLCLFLQVKFPFSQFFSIAVTCLRKFFHLLICVTSISGILLPIVNLQYHWNQPRGSCLKIQPFSIQCSLDNPETTLNLFKFTLNVSLRYSTLTSYFSRSTHKKEEVGKRDNCVLSSLYQYTLMKSEHVYLPRLTVDVHFLSLRITS